MSIYKNPRDVRSSAFQRFAVSIRSGVVIPERIASLIISGSHPYAENIYGFRALLSQGLEPFLAACRRRTERCMRP